MNIKDGHDHTPLEIVENEAKLTPSPQQIIQATPSRPYFFGIDLLRIFACYMVMQIHGGEFYYFNKDATVMAGTSPFWVGIYNSLFRSCVPLFVMISGYLLLPVKTDIPTFLKTRFTRVLFPFIFWCIVHSFYYYFLKKISLKECFLNIPKIFVNYGTDVGHLWYIYMLIGVYLFAPIISPWIKIAPKGQFLYYLSFWAISNCLCYIHLIFPEVWGECFWNNTPMLQSFTGHFGYAVLGAFIKIHLQNNDLYWLALIITVVGYIITVVIWEIQYYRQVYTAPDLELGWNFHSINVAMMTCGIFLLMRKIQCRNDKVVKFFKDVSLKTYGMYLSHIMFLDAFHELIDPHSKNVHIYTFLVSIVSFIAAYICCKIISFIPYSQYLIG